VPAGRAGGATGAPLPGVDVMAAAISGKPPRPWIN
jgi:hypothetical protein